ncbi:MaoC family dehydratase [Citreimonas salinaria]|uniref:Acyl dehydratase n=1 Tax=Citreimonas salinaria TaxID=321339 RepID=A0A1H3JJF0_9RHOB|nr:MaoC family dehydratase [Citreimonas salinaria]SDY40061.1 Acyl dehydratase [Citreimonas salinaria]
MIGDDLRALPPRKSGWFVLDEARVRAFAEVTGDWQFVHFDDDRARAETPFGGAIAHGFLTLSMLSAMSYEVTEDLPVLSASVNYGFDRIRFVTPVPVGSRIRGSFAVAGVDEGEGWLNIHWDVELEIEGSDQPALVAAWITRAFVKD